MVTSSASHPTADTADATGPTQAPTEPASFSTQFALLTTRNLARAIREPASIVPNVAISVFFLFIYNGSFGDADHVSSLTGGEYINFTLPVAILFVAFSAGAAGYSLLTDQQTGYFRRQLSMPLSRAAIVAAAVFQGALLAVALSVLIISLGFALGASATSGVGGIVVIVGMSVLWALGFAGYSVSVSLLTGSAAAVQGFNFLLFPIMFLSPVFLPEDQLAGWMQALATVNPTTYVLQGMRSLLIEGWQPDVLWPAFTAAGALALLTLTAAGVIARRMTVDRP